MNMEKTWLIIEEAGTGEQKRVPVLVIAKDRARHYADEYGGDVDLSLKLDTIPLFEGDLFEIEDWAANNMNWTDVEEFAVDIPNSANDPDWQEAWVNGDKTFGEF